MTTLMALCAAFPLRLTRPVHSYLLTNSGVGFFGNFIFWVTKLGQIHSNMFKLFTFTYDFLALGAG